MTSHSKNKRTRRHPEYQEQAVAPTRKSTQRHILLPTQDPPRAPRWDESPSQPDQFWGWIVRILVTSISIIHSSHRALLAYIFGWLWNDKDMVHSDASSQGEKNMLPSWVVQQLSTRIHTAVPSIQPACSLSQVKNRTSLFLKWHLIFSLNIQRLLKLFSRIVSYLSSSYIHRYRCRSYYCWLLNT